MLSRKVEALGTKASGTWTLTVDDGVPEDGAQDGVSADRALEW